MSMYHTSMYHTRASAKRTCHACEAIIMKGEEHYAVDTKSKNIKQWWNVRINFCMLCALQKLKDQAIENVGMYRQARNYIKLHPELNNRRILKKIQDGSALQPEENWEGV